MASDMFALGLILFEMLAGKHLTEVILGARATTSQRVQLAYTMAQVLPRVSSVRPDAPRVLDDLVARLLELDASLRPSAPDVRLQLQRLGKELRAVAPSSLATGERTDPLPASPAGPRPLNGGSYAPTEPVPEISPRAPVAGPRGTVKMEAFRDPLFDAPGGQPRSPAPLPVVPPPSFGPPPAPAVVASPSPPAAHAEPLVPFGRQAMGSSPYPPVVAPLPAGQAPRGLDPRAGSAGSTAGLAKPPTPRSPLVIIATAAVLGLIVVLAAWFLAPRFDLGSAGAAPASSHGAAP